MGWGEKKTGEEEEQAAMEEDKEDKKMRKEVRARCEERAEKL